MKSVKHTIQKEGKSGQYIDHSLSSHIVEAEDHQDGPSENNYDWIYAEDVKDSIKKLKDDFDEGFFSPEYIHKKIGEIFGKRLT